MTGSGMGCPDWPKCFGLWVPPTDESDLPVNYKELYQAKYKNKQIKCDDDLSFLEFNVFKTWTEYINRLMGAVAGLCCLFLTISSFFTKNKKIIFGSLFLIFLFAFQAWMGSVVVYSVLDPINITIHMLIALLILAILFLLFRITLLSKIKIDNVKKYWVFSALIISLIQIILGTQVREGVDQILSPCNSAEFITNLNFNFEIHRTIAWLVIVSNFSLLYFYRKSIDTYIELKTILFILILLIISGLFMTYKNLLGIGQLLHLSCAVGLFIAQFSLLLKHYRFSILKIPSLQ